MDLSDLVQKAAGEAGDFALYNIPVFVIISMPA